MHKTAEQYPPVRATMEARTSPPALGRFLVHTLSYLGDGTVTNEKPTPATFLQPLHTL